MNAAIRTALVARAAAQVAQYPQYANAFDKCVVVMMRKTIKLKGGLSFTKGEMVLVDPTTRAVLTESYNPKLNGRETVTAWSMTRGVHCSVFVSDTSLAQDEVTK